MTQQPEPTRSDPFAGMPNARDEWSADLKAALAPPPVPQLAAGLTPQERWELLRRILRDDLARYQKSSKHSGDFWSYRADAFQLVLDSMNTLEFGAESTMKIINERYPVPGLAEHTEAACDTITQASTS